MNKAPECLLGRRFGKLTVVSAAPRERDEAGILKRQMWNCKCDCGGVKTAISQNLKKQSTTSCGCKAYTQPGRRAVSQFQTRFRKPYRGYASIQELLHA